MSLKNLMKRIFTVIEMNINSGLDNMASTEKRLTQAARKLSVEIYRLEKARLQNFRQTAKFKHMAEQNRTEAARREQTLIEAKGCGKELGRATAVIVLQRLRMAEALENKIKETSGVDAQIREAIIQLGERLEDVKANLELITLQRETEDLGLTLPEDIDYSVGLANIDVDSIIREVEITDPKAMINTPSSIEVENYLANL